MIICEAQHSQTTGSDYLVPETVILLLILVDRSIYFNDKADLMAVEVSNEAVHRQLTPKMQVIQMIATKILPE